MCDTLYFNKGGRAFFGKNSDRAPNEAHLMIRVPRKEYSDGAAVKATYIEIPQAKTTNACVLLKPHWIWGAEMGWNEYGLNIGNEALFTNVKREKTDGLLGMDMLRLALERCSAAEDAVSLIISLLEKYGQGGNCAFGKKFYYDNAFLIADVKECFVLETAGRQWAVKRAGDAATISNCISLREDYDSASKGVKGDFKKQFQNNLFTAVAGAERRRQCTMTAIMRGAAEESCIAALSAHSGDIGVGESSTDSPCMHAGNMFGDQTTGSYFGEIGKRYFVTGSSFPCLSVFKPLTPSAEILPEDEKTALGYWLKRELLNRHIMSGNIDTAAYETERRALQKKILDAALSADGTEKLSAVSAQCFAEEETFVDKFLSQANGKEINVKGGAYFRHYWKKQTEKFREIYGV